MMRGRSEERVVWKSYGGSILGTGDVFLDFGTESGLISLLKAS